MGGYPPPPLKKKTYFLNPIPNRSFASRNGLYCCVKNAVFVVLDLLPLRLLFVLSSSIGGTLIRGDAVAPNEVIGLVVVAGLVSVLGAVCVIGAVIALASAFTFTSGAVSVAGCVTALVNGLVMAAVRVIGEDAGLANMLSPMVASVKGAVLVRGSALTAGNVSPFTSCCNLASSPFVKVLAAGSLKVVGFALAAFGASCNCGVFAGSTLALNLKSLCHIPGLVGLDSRNPAGGSDSGALEYLFIPTIRGCVGSISGNVFMGASTKATLSPASN